MFDKSGRVFLKLVLFTAEFYHDVCLVLPHRALQDYRRFCSHLHVVNVPFVESLSKVRGTPNQTGKLRKTVNNGVIR